MRHSDDLESVSQLLRDMAIQLCGISASPQPPSQEPGAASPVSAD